MFEFLKMKNETLSLSGRFEELKNSKFQLIAQYKELDQCLKAQVERNRALAQENGYLQEELLSKKQIESARGNLELELLSNEETQELV